MMEAQTVDMTAEEETELATLAADMPEPEADTTQTRLDEIEATLMELDAMIGGE